MLKKIVVGFGNTHKKLILHALPSDIIVTQIESSLPQVMVNLGGFRVHNKKKINYRC
jgi:hypothetical protein